MTSIVDDKGRVSIPKKFRDLLDIKTGNEIEFTISGNILLLRKTIDVDEFKQVADKIRKDIIERIGGIISTYWVVKFPDDVKDVQELKSEDLYNLLLN